MRFSPLFAAAVVGLYFPPSATSQQLTLPEIARRAKAATALVEVAGGFKHGSAFGVHASGIYLSNEHVVRGAAEVKLVLHPGLKQQQIVRARVVRVDKELDLALLRVLDKAEHSTLPIGSSDGLAELAEVVAVGFPFGKALAVKGEYPAVSVNSGRVSALRLKKGELERIQMDAVVNPGNSGGPVLDKQGKVIGVVVSGVPGTLVNFAIPASHVHKFVATPDVEVMFPSIAHADRHKPTVFQVRAVTIVPSKDEYKVELILGGKGKPERSFPMSLAEGLYRATAEALKKEAAPKSVRVTLNFAQGSMQGETGNYSLAIGKEQLQLGDLRALRFDKAATAILADGKSVTGALKGLDEISVDLGGESVKLNATRARELIVHLPPPDVAVAYTVIVHRGNKVVARVEDALSFRDVPSGSISDPTKAAFAPPILSGETATVKLPAPVDDLVVGGNGRFLILHFSKTRSLGIFDVSLARLVHNISLSDNNVAFAAGMDKLVLAYPNTNIYSRYNLHTGERELLKAIDLKEKVISLTMGSASHGPILVRGPRGPGDEGLMITFLDIDLQVLPTTVKDPIVIGWRDNGKLGIRASTNGRTFAMWAPKSRPAHMQILTYEPGATRIFSNRDHAGSIVPSHDGSTLHTSWSGLYTGQAKPVDGTKDDKRTVSVPAHGYPYYMRLPSANAFVNIKDLPKGISIHLAGDTRVVATAPLTEEMPDNLDAWGEGTLTADKRVHFVPDAKVIVALPKTDDKLILQRFDMDAALARANFDYLFVTSTPPALARRGEKITHAVQTKSNRGGVTCKLLGGPAGMTVTPAGELAWDVPKDQPVGDVDVIIAHADASRQEMFHSFKIMVR